MKFIPRLIYEITVGIFNAVKKLFTGFKNYEKHDFYLIICGFSLLMSFLNLWFLTLALITIYPALHNHLSIHDGLIQLPIKLNSELDSKLLEEQKKKTNDDNNVNNNNSSKDDNQEGVAESSQMNNPSNTNSSRTKSAPNQKSKQSSAPTEKKKKGAQQKAKEEWGLPTLRVVDQYGKVITVNPEKPTPIESEYFKGVILIMLKCDGEFAEYNRYSDHFGKKQRKFEVQFQGQMKTLPQGEVMLGGELSDKMQVSFIMRSLLSIIMKFAMSLNPFLHFSFGEDSQPDGRYECPHLTFPLFRVMDRVVATPPGEELPELGKELPESEADRVLRRNGKGVNCFKEGYTYSFSFHSMYVDFSRWIICNFPGYRAIDLTGFLGQQKVKVICYELVDPNAKSSDDKTPPPYHYSSFKRYIMYMEMAHTSIMSSEELASAEEIFDKYDTPLGADDEITREEEGLVEGEGDAGAGDADVEGEGEGINQEEPNNTRSDIEDSESGSDDEFDRQRGNTIEQLESEVPEDLPTHLEQEDDVGTLKPGSEYVIANTLVSLLSSPLPTDPQSPENNNDEDHEDCFERLEYGIADVGGAAVRKECHDIPVVRFIRAPTPVPVVPSTQSNLTALRNPLSSLRRSIAVAQTGMSRGMSRSGSISVHSSQVTSDESIHMQTRSLEDIETNNVLSAGDEVMIQCGSTGKYLTVHRGWWVYWTSYDNGLKSVFTIEILNSSGLTYAPHGTKLVSGVPFRLKPTKWPQWEVGCYDRPVSGRQMVVLFQSLSTPNRIAPTGPIKWGKNGRMVYPLSISVLSDLSTPGTYTNLKQSETKNTEDVMKRDSDEISPLSFFDFNITFENTLPALDLKVDIVASAEVYNRTLHQSQLAYVLRVSYTSKETNVQWTTLRTQEDMDLIFSKIPVELGGGTESTVTDNNQNSKRRSYYGSIPSLRTISTSTSTSSPQFSSPVKLEQLKRATSFATVSARHQCSADQSVYLMSKRIQTLLDRDRDRDASVTVPPSPSPPTLATSSPSMTTPPPNTRSHSASSADPHESPRSQTSSDNVDSHDFTLPPPVLPVFGTSPKQPSVLDKFTSDWKGNESNASRTTAQAAAANPKSILLQAFSKPELLDTLFLHDTDPEKYLPSLRRAPPRIHTCLVARALWDTHWREEIAILYSSYIACYPLQGTKPAWVLSLQEIIGVSYLPEETSPLPRFSVMRIETIGRIHYLAFISKDVAQVLAAKIKENITHVSFDTPIPSFVELTDPRDRFVVKSGRWRPAGRRLILNARKFTFDMNQPTQKTDDNNISNNTSTMSETYWMFSARLLKTVFQLDSNNSIRINSESIKKNNQQENYENSSELFETPTVELFPGKDKITSFLDETVMLKYINLHDDINFSSIEAFCFFVNIYHTLLVHARLVLNPPSAKDWSSFYETVCYEIGSDVFSLSELEHCVICGKLERPINLPRNFCLPPPINDDHYAYTLQHPDCRARFIVNCCSISNLPTIYLLTPENLYRHLNEASVTIFETYLDVNVKNRTVILPKLLDTFKGDFGSSPQEVLRHILRYLGKEDWEKISILLATPKPPIMKYLDMKCVSHDSLQLIA